ncbi:unnamed protein product, partial [Timema podura]|nr:unnamed protein product [Timema podura]
MSQEGWASSLRVSVEQFVVDHCWGEGVSPRLVAMCSTSQTAPPSQRRLHCTEVHRSYHELKRRFHRLNKDHHNLIGITTELTSALESSVQGQAVDLKTTLNNCTRIFPELFKQAQARPE